MGLFARTGASSTTPTKDGAKTKKHKPFRIELGWRGMFSLILVCLCLFFWMFVLGIWAGQTILFPQKQEAVPRSSGSVSHSVASQPLARIAEQDRPVR